MGDTKVSWRVRIVAICQKLSKTFGSDVEYLPVFKDRCRANREQNADTILESNPEHLLVFRFHAGMVHKSNSEHLLVFKAPSRDDPRVQSGTPPGF